MQVKSHIIAAVSISLTTISCTGFDWSSDDTPRIRIESAGSAYANGSIYTFSNTVVGAPVSPVLFSIINTGSGTIHLKDPIIKTGAQAADYSLTQPASLSIAPAARVNFSLAFNPSAIGTRNAYIDILSDAPENSNYRIQLTGSGYPTYTQVISGEANLIHYWRLGENSGTTAADSKGSHNGVYNGGVTLNVAGAIAGDSNGAIYLDGATGYVLLQSGNPNYSNMANGSIEFWTTEVTGTILREGDTSSATFNCPIFAMSYLSISAFGGNSYGFSNPGISTGAGTWHHVVYTWDGVNMALYDNGVQVAITGGNGATMGGSVSVLGMIQGVCGNGWSAGYMDELAIYNIALTPAQVLNHYKTGTGAP